MHTQRAGGATDRGMSAGKGEIAEMLEEEVGHGESTMITIRTIVSMTLRATVIVSMTVVSHTLLEMRKGGIGDHQIGDGAVRAIDQGAHRSTAVTGSSREM